MDFISMHKNLYLLNFSKANLATLIQNSQKSKITEKRIFFLFSIFVSDARFKRGAGNLFKNSDG